MEEVSKLVALAKENIDFFFDHLDIESFNEVKKLLLNCKGMIFFTGVGKSGLIAQKIAVTMTSTGTRSLYLSTQDALHGDIGLVTKEDLFFLLSRSGETEELLNLIPSLRNKGAKLIAVVSKKESRLEKACDYSVILPLSKELCPFDMAPTTSSEIQMIFGDILAISVMKEKKFSLDQYILNHPAGSIGKKITLKVKDLMVKGKRIPLCKPDDRLGDIIYDLSNKQCGCILIHDRDHRLLGIFTDGDLRRALQKYKNQVFEKPIKDLMTLNPRSIEQDILVTEAVKVMEEDQKHPIMVLPVVDKENHIEGLLKMHDILQSGI